MNQTERQDVINAVVMLKEVCQATAICRECPLYSDSHEMCAFTMSPKHVVPVGNKRCWRAVK